MRRFDPKGCGKRLAFLRRRLGLKQKDIAELTGRSTSAVGFWEIGKSVIPTEVIAKLVETYNVNPLWLLFGEGSMFLEEKTFERELYNLSELEKESIFLKEMADSLIKSGKYQISAGESLKRFLKSIFESEKEE